MVRFSIRVIIASVCLAAYCFPVLAAPPRLFPARRYSPIISFNLDPQDVADRAVRIAAREGDLERMVEAISDGGRIEGTSERGLTALMNASRGCHVEVMRSLIARGAQLDVQDKKGRTALIIAAGSACLPAVRLLLRKGARTDFTDHRGRTALEHAEAAAALEVGGPATRSKLLILKARGTKSKAPR